MSEPAKNIGEAKLRIMEAVCYVQKTGKMGNDGGGDRGPKYAFASEVDLIRNVRPAMLEHGVGISCFRMDSANEMFTNPGYEGKPGKATSRRIITCGFRFTHYASDTSEDQWVVGEGTDNGDKASYKAMTGAIKYALRQWLLIETGDDPDKTASPQDAKDDGLQKKLAKATAEIRNCPDLKWLDSYERKVLKSDPALRDPLMNAIGKRRDELIRTTEAGANG